MPLDFVKTVVGFRQTNQGLKCSTFFIAPNLSFDYYEIKAPSSLNLSRSDFEENVETGFLTIDSLNRIQPTKAFNERPLESVVGVWVSNISSETLRNPVLWAACARLILCEALFQGGINSPSSDKNTFMVATFTKDDPHETLRVYEFKIVQNPIKKGGTQRNYNSWVVLHSQQNVATPLCDEI